MSIESSVRIDNLTATRSKGEGISASESGRPEVKGKDSFNRKQGKKFYFMHTCTMRKELMIKKLPTSTRGHADCLCSASPIGFIKIIPHSQVRLATGRQTWVRKERIVLQVFLQTRQLIPYKPQFSKWCFRVDLLEKTLELVRQANSGKISGFTEATGSRMIEFPEVPAEASR